MITLLPNAPSRGDPPDVFDPEADAWAGALGLFTTELNALGTAYNLATTGTSTSSILIGTGDKTFTTQAGLGFVPGMQIRIANTATPTNYMDGVVKTYSSTTLVATISATSGSGTLAAWTISLGASAGGASLASNTFTGKQNFAQGADIACASTVNLSSATGNTVRLTGNTTVNAVTLSDGSWVKAVFTGTPILTYNATTQNINSGGANITDVAAGDSCFYFAANGITYGIFTRLNGKAVASTVTSNVRQTVISGAVGGDAATCTISNATPGVVTHTAHGKEANTPIVFTTTGALPTGLSLLTQYYVSATGLTANTYQVSATAGGASINTSSAGSGTHTVTYGVINNANGTPLLGGALGATSVVTSNINATTPLRVSYAGGYNASGQVDLVGTSTANLTFSSLSTNGTMYGFLTYSAGGNTTSTGTLAPVVQQQGIPSIVNGQYTYNIKEAKMYLGNGSVASAVNAVHVATFTVAASVVSAITWQPFQSDFNDAELLISPLILTTSGTIQEYTNIPPNTKKVNISFNANSTSGTSIPMVQLGDSTSYKTTGYTGTSVTSALTTGVLVYSSWTAASLLYGSITFTLVDPINNVWSFSITTALTGASGGGGGLITLSSQLTRIRLTMVNGTDTFDAGSFSVTCE
jgi:hypothetical protein